VLFRSRVSLTHELFGQPGDPECGRSHVDAAAIAAKVEGHADDMNGTRHPSRIPGRGFVTVMTAGNPAWTSAGIDENAKILII